MFGFRKDDAEKLGSHGRFPARVEKHRDQTPYPKLVHGFWWVVHNCISHPLIGVCPVKPFFEFHDWTSIKLNAGKAGRH